MGSQANFGFASRDRGTTMTSNGSGRAVSSRLARASNTGSASLSPSRIRTGRRTQYQLGGHHKRGR
ncbi:MAG TPA: hypothetical protein VHZ03_26555 [Trebonia sp.]|nr:hypothetical protein [Trebonia sp.]